MTEDTDVCVLWEGMWASFSLVWSLWKWMVSSSRGTEGEEMGAERDGRAFLPLKSPKVLDSGTCFGDRA